MEDHGARVVAVCDAVPERLAKAQQRYPAIRAITRPDDLFAATDIDAVVIATPVASHFDLTLRALQAGKHVLVEKPLAATSDQASRLIEEAARRRLIMMVDHTFIYTGAVRRMRELIESGDCGDIIYYDSTRINLGLFQNDVDVMWDLAVHDLSIMDYVLRVNPAAVSATGMCHVSTHLENVAYMTLFFPGTLIAHIHVSWLSPVKIRRTLVGGMQKMIVYDDLEPSEKIKVYDKGIDLTSDPERRHQLMISYRAGDMWAPRLDTTEALAVEARHFVECIRTGSPPITDGLSGLRVIRILEAATRSMETRGQPVELSI